MSRGVYTKTDPTGSRRPYGRAQRTFDGAFGSHAIYPASDDPDVRRGDYGIPLG